MVRDYKPRPTRSKKTNKKPVLAWIGGALGLFLGVGITVLVPFFYSDQVTPSTVALLEQSKPPSVEFVDKSKQETKRSETHQPSFDFHYVLTQESNIKPLKFEPVSESELMLKPAIPTQKTNPNTTEKTSQVARQLTEKKVEKQGTAKKIGNKKVASNLPQRSPTVETVLKQAVAHKEPVVNAQEEQAVSIQRQTQYLLQAGTFAQASQADALRARLILSGYTAKVKKIYRANQLSYRVYVGPFDSKKQQMNAKYALLQEKIRAYPRTVSY